MDPSILIAAAAVIVSSGSVVVASRKNRADGVHLVRSDAVSAGDLLLRQLQAVVAAQQAQIDDQQAQITELRERLAKCEAMEAAMRRDRDGVLVDLMNLRRRKDDRDGIA